MTEPECPLCGNAAGPDAHRFSMTNDAAQVLRNSGVDDPGAGLDRFMLCNACSNLSLEERRQRLPDAIARILLEGFGLA